MREKRGNRKALDPVGEDGVTGKDGKGFFACYLLTSLSPRHKGQTYIGYLFLSSLILELKILLDQIRLRKDLHFLGLSD